MSAKRDIIFVFVVTIGLLAVLTGWLEYKDQNTRSLTNVELNEDLEVPRALKSSTTAVANESMADTQNITLQTNHGDIVLELFTGAMPVTAGNFIKLASEGFYNGTKFHRVIDGFMIQGGDPNTKTENTASYGQGGPGYTIQDEFVEGALFTNSRGTISMANNGQPNSGGSQFFINLVDNLGLDFNKEPLQSKHPVFGRVVSGMNVVDKIAKVETTGLQGSTPVEPVVIMSVVTSEE